MWLWDSSLGTQAKARVRRGQGSSSDQGPASLGAWLLTPHTGPPPQSDWAAAPAEATPPTSLGGADCLWGCTAMRRPEGPQGSWGEGNGKREAEGAAGDTQVTEQAGHTSPSDQHPASPCVGLTGRSALAPYGPRTQPLHLTEEETEAQGGTGPAQGHTARQCREGWAGAGAHVLDTQSSSSTSGR